MKKIATAVAAVTFVGLASLTACQNDSDVVSENLSKEADEYKVMRQIVVYNAITDTYILEVTGYCSLGNDDPASQVSYTCKSPGGYVKDIIKKSDNTFVFVHQLHPVQVSDDYFEVVVKPSTVIPDFDVR